jgi:arabinan endo-1,5-alpha-L-arabinosidase
MSLMSRRRFLRGTAGSVMAVNTIGHTLAQESKPEAGASETNNIDFEKTLKRMRFDLYQHPPTDIIKEGFRPVGGSLADFAIVHHQGREHVFYIERRLQEGTPFFPGHEIYFGHASTPDFFEWEVRDPVMLIRPGTWEEAHVWAPYVLKDGGEHVMCYTGLNRHLSQDLGLASSRDLFEWRRWETNPISPLRKSTWAAWWTNEICSCRDPYLLRHDGLVWLLFTANTREGASCLALFSSPDLRRWEDRGPILIGPATGYEPHLWGGHPQGSLESACLLQRRGKWFVIVNATIRGKGGGSWIAASDRMDHFEYAELRRFWQEGGCIEFVRHDGDRTLIAGLAGGRLKFGEVNWAETAPVARSVDREQLLRWQRVPPA